MIYDLLKDVGNTNRVSCTNCFTLEAENKKLKEQLKISKRKLQRVQGEKLSSDEHALRLSKELQLMKDKNKFTEASFSEQEGIPMTVADLDELNGRATTDSMFAGLLAVRLVGADNLIKMSVTGQACHRYANMKKEDGTRLYPTPKKLDPNVLQFICNKIAERTAIRVGLQNVLTIRQYQK
ncbi:uncharacterized protein LOC129757905 [Uranotaenia lowii]|uniref:uncharacterized protein LOC129757905 n=1 Tax=Uranotaenia lowii TaxID=190385 RepID=UPI00247AA6BE|nr:uncharacterized protein LOC129757905 [Uranotaenia lowii]